jgi:hypothetical protein
VLDHGGRVLTDASLYLIYWGASWCSAPRPDASQVSDAVTRLVAGPYLKPLAQYRGAGLHELAYSSVLCTSDPPSPFSIDAVASMVLERIANGAGAEPVGADRLYMVVMPSGAKPDAAGITGAHATFDYAEGAPVPFAWVASDDGLDALTVRIAHLIVDACTDPEGDGFRVSDERSPYDWLEVANLCAAPLRLDGVAAQPYWSLEQGRCLDAGDFNGAPEPARRLVSPGLDQPGAAPIEPVSVPARHPGPSIAVRVQPGVMPPGLPPRTDRPAAFDSPYTAGLYATAAFVPLAGIVVSAMLYIVAFAPLGIMAKIAAPVGGLLVSLAAWLLAGIPGRRVAESHLANIDEYGQIRLRLEQLRPRINALVDPTQPPLPLTATDALREARELAAMLDKDLSQPGIRWLLAHGYIHAWMTIHRAEEALLVGDRVGRVIGEGLNDELRLEDSQIPHADELLTRLRRAIRALSPSSADRYLHAPNGLPGISTDDGAGVDPMDVARNLLRTVRRAINEYRDELWSGLVRSRNQLRWTVLISGTTAYLLLIVLLLVGLDSRAVVGAGIFFIFGAEIGLIARLRRESEADKAIEDFGLERARLIAAPLLSGLASVFGVLIMGLAHVKVGGVSFGPEPPTGRSVPALVDIFNLAANPTGFIGAAIFGLTPSLLIDYLQAQTSSFKQALKISEATGGMPAAAKETKT